MASGRVQRGWALAKRSYGVLKSDRSLLLFPIVSMIVSVVTAVIFFGPGVTIYGSEGQEPMLVLFGVVTLYALSAVTLFFNTALAAAAVKALAGGQPTMADGIEAARDRLRPITEWALVQTTVGLVLAALEGLLQHNVIGRVIASLADLAWGVATFFVVPVIALEGLGPRDAFRRSVALVRERWGEGVVGTASISGLVFLVALPVLVVLGGGGWALLDRARLPAVILLLLAGLVFVAAMVVGGTLTAIFRVALYQFATTEEAPAQFEDADLANAFRPKRRRGAS